MADTTHEQYHTHISSRHRWLDLNLKEVLTLVLSKIDKIR